MTMSVVSFISKLNLILFLYLDNIHPTGGHELNVILFLGFKQYFYFFFPSTKLFLHFHT